MLRGEIDMDAFRGFVTADEPRLRQALSAGLGSQMGRDATVDALSFAWENWERIAAMENPVRYLYAVGRDRGRKSLQRNRPVFYPALDGWLMAFEGGKRQGTPFFEWSTATWTLGSYPATGRALTPKIRSTWLSLPNTSKSSSPNPTGTR